MYILHSKILLNNHFLKVSAFIIGCLLWSILSESHRSHITLTVPLYFYSVPDTLKIDAPDTITLTLAGKRTDLRKIDYTKLGAHIDATTLRQGRNVLDLTSRDLLLPDDIILVKYTPVHLIVLS